MATVLFKTLSVWLLAGVVAVCADDAAKPVRAAVKAQGKAVTIKAAPSKAAPGAVKTAAGKMQVEEPKTSAPLNDARESKAWQKTHAKGLTEEQKTAFRDRKVNMEAMITVIKAKRKALQNAKPEDRAALARELHSLILEKDGEGSASVTAAARVEGQTKEEKPALAAKPGESAESQRAQRREEYRKQMEKLRQWNSGQDE